MFAPRERRRRCLSSALRPILHRILAVLPRSSVPRRSPHANAASAVSAALPVALHRLSDAPPHAPASLPASESHPQGAELLHQCEAAPRSDGAGDEALRRRRRHEGASCHERGARAPFAVRCVRHAATPVIAAAIVRGFSARLGRRQEAAPASPAPVREPSLRRGHRRRGRRAGPGTGARGLPPLVPVQGEPTRASRCHRTNSRAPPCSLWRHVASAGRFRLRFVSALLRNAEIPDSS